MNKIFALVFIAFSCQSNEIDNEETAEFDHKDSLVQTSESSERIIARFKENYDHNTDSVTIKLFGQWRIDSIYQKSSFFRSGSDCRLFHDWGGYNEGYCEKPNDQFDLPTKLIYHFSKDTLGIYYEVKDKNGLPILNEKTIKTKYLVLKINRFSLTLFNVRSEITEFLSKFD